MIIPYFHYLYKIFMSKANTGNRFVLPPLADKKNILEAKTHG